jgi:hypothetical protein
MPRPEKWIPLSRIEGLATLLDEGYTQAEIAEYYSAVLPYSVDQKTISNKLKRLKETRTDDTGIRERHR